MKARLFHLHPRGNGLSLRGFNHSHPVHMKATQRHSFHAEPTLTGMCKVYNRASPQDSGLSSKVFRNVYQYPGDSENLKVAPNLPWLLFFLNSVKLSLVLPGPTWLAVPRRKMLGIVDGSWFGGYILGH